MIKQVLNWWSPRGDEPVAIQINLDASSAQWLLDHLPLNDGATNDLRRAVARLNSPESEG